MRDPRITLCGDGFYYLTGTTRIPGSSYPTAMLLNDGVRMWRSHDLRHWDDPGLVWSLDREGTWNRFIYRCDEEKVAIIDPKDLRSDELPPGAVTRRSVWAPEVNWLPQRGVHIVSASMSYNMGVLPKFWPTRIFGTSFLLRINDSSPAGPYTMTTGGPLAARPGLEVADPGPRHYQPRSHFWAVWGTLHRAALRWPRAHYAGPRGTLVGTVLWLGEWRRRPHS